MANNVRDFTVNSLQQFYNKLNNDILPTYASMTYVESAYAYILNEIVDNEYVIAQTFNSHNDRITALENADTPTGTLTGVKLNGNAVTVNNGIAEVNTTYPVTINTDGNFATDGAVHLVTADHYYNDIQTAINEGKTPYIIFNGGMIIPYIGIITDTQTIEFGTTVNQLSIYITIGTNTANYMASRALTSESQADWNVTDNSSYAYILNKPEIQTCVIEIISNELESITSAPSGTFNKCCDAVSNGKSIILRIKASENNIDDCVDYILGTVNIRSNEYREFWFDGGAFSSIGLFSDDSIENIVHNFINESTLSEQSYITSTALDTRLNNAGYLTAETQSDWNVTNTSSAAYIKNKPTIPSTLDDILDGNTRKLSNYLQLSGGTMNVDTSINIPGIVGGTELTSNYIHIKGTDTDSVHSDLGQNYLILSDNGPVSLLYANSLTFSASERDSDNFIGTQYKNGEIVKKISNDIIYSLTFPNKTGTFALTSDIPSTVGLATETYVNNKVAGIVNSAPETLDTLNELAAALGNDPNFATTVSTEIGTKVSKTELAGLGYVTQTTLSAQSYITSDELETILDDSGYISSIPTNYITTSGATLLPNAKLIITDYGPDMFCTVTDNIVQVNYADGGGASAITSDGVFVTNDGDYDNAQNYTIYHDDSIVRTIGNSSNTINLPSTSGTIALTSDIPTAVTESTVAGWGFTKNAGTLTSESDPTVPSYVKSITQTNINAWNSYANVQADWNEYDSSKATYILNKPETYWAHEVNGGLYSTWGGPAGASGNGSLAVGSRALAGGECSLAIGNFVNAFGDNSQAFGIQTTAYAPVSHVEGNYVHAFGIGSHGEGLYTTTGGQSSHAEGGSKYSYYLDTSSTTLEGIITYWMSFNDPDNKFNFAGGNYSHTEGFNTLTSGFASHAEGGSTYAAAAYTHAEGWATFALGERSHSEGTQTVASGNYSHAEGSGTTASGEASHVEGGWYNVASGICSHSEGSVTKALGNYTHAEGTQTVAYAAGSHAEGRLSYTIGNYSHSEGYYTYTYNVAEHAEGQYNQSHKANTTFGNGGNTIHSIGIGTAANSRKNAVEIMQNGYAYFLNVGNYNGTNLTSAKPLHTVISDLSSNIPAAVTESTVSGWGFTKNAGTITGITMNGASKGTSGVVDLGTVLTAHQDISGKQDTITDLATIRSNASSGAAKVSANDSTITIQKGGTNVDTFTTNAASNKTINIPNELPTYSSSDAGKVLSINSSGQLVWITPVNIYTGTGEPSNSMGNDGDIYLQS